MSAAPLINEDVVLRASKLTKYFGTLKAVNEVCLTLARGECLAILGPNGAGKTTLCEIFEGLVSQDSGDLEILSYRYQDSRANILEKIGVTLQETALYKRYTVEETLTLFASFYPSSLPILQLLQDLDLLEIKDRRLGQLSGGQKQRVCLASAFGHNPDILFLDEPTNGLDPKARREIWALVSRLKAMGKSIILTTHFMEEAERLADRIAILDQGKIVGLGSLDELFTTFGVKEYLEVGVEGGLLELLKKRHGFLVDEVKTARGYSFFLQDASQRVQEVVQTCSELGGGLRFISVKQASLEDLFLKLTGRSFANDC